MRIEQLKIKNFKAFRHVEMRDIPNFCVIVGANGSGKSTLFNIFGFLQEALQSNVQTALVKQGGSKGFSEVRSRNSDGNIEIEIKFRAKTTGRQNPLITYALTIGARNNKAYVAHEVLKYRRGKHGNTWAFLNFADGKGKAVTNEGLTTVKNVQDLEREEQHLKANNILAIKGLAQFDKFPAAVALGNLIERWHLSDIHISKAREEQQAGADEHLSREGDNLSLVIDHLHNNHHDTLQSIIEKLKRRVPGVFEIFTKTIETGQVLLKIRDKSFQDPFLVRHVSDGTIKMLAYLVLLNDPHPHGLLCVEEPENQLYPKLLEELAEEFRLYAQNDNQVFVSTHSPDFLNAAKLPEVFMLVKDGGYTAIRRAADDPQLKAYVADGGKMGELWKEGWFTGVDP